MKIDHEKLLALLSSTEAHERMAGIRILQEDLYIERPDLPVEVIQALERIATSDENKNLKTEAVMLLGRAETPEPPSNTKNDSGKLYLIGKIFLGLMIALHILYLYSEARTYIVHYNSPPDWNFSFTDYPAHITLLSISIIVLLIALFMVKKYPIVIGVLLLGLGVIPNFFWIEYPPLGTSSGGIEVLYLCCPVGLVILIFGSLFLRDGLIRRKNKLNEEKIQT